MKNSLLDLRFVIGAFFSLVGLMLLVFAFVSAEGTSQRINTWSGAGFLVFGIIMLLLSRTKDESDEIIDSPGDMSDSEVTHT